MSILIIALVVLVVGGVFYFVASEKNSH